MPEQESSFNAAAVPEVQNKAPKAPGILPKNAQTWVIVIISAIMIVLIAFSNSSAPKTSPKSAGATQQNASLPTQRQIDQYRAMVDEEARKLAAERQRLDQAKAEFQTASVNAPAPAGQTGSYQNQYPQPQQSASSSKEQSPVEMQRLAIEAERKKREYNSLFSSNVALSYRPDPKATAGAGDESTADGRSNLQGIGAKLSQLKERRAALESEGETSAPKMPTVSVTPEGTQKVSLPPDRKLEATPQDSAKQKSRPDDPALQQADGKKYRLFEGTVLETVLTNRLNGSFSGPVNAMVTTNVYSHDHQHLLIPQGSRVLGEVQKLNSFGQDRLAVTFHRLLMADGYSLSLDQFHGLNQIGETGLRDQVNHHYLQIFGVSLAIGAIAGIEQAGANYGYNTSGVDLYRQGVSESLSQSALRILDRYLNILPTFVIREGHRVKVYLTDDLLLPAYDRHRLPADL
jgi:type IV secretion system protein VirB10